MQLSYFIVYDIMAGIVCWYGVLRVALEMQHDWCENRLGYAPTLVVAAFLIDSALVYIYIQWYICKMSAASAYLHIVFIRCIRDPVSRCWVG